MLPQFLRLLTVAVLILGIVLHLRHRLRGGVIVAVAIGLQLALLVQRGVAIGFFPLASLQDVLVFLGIVVLGVHWGLTRHHGGSVTQLSVYAAVSLMILISALLPTQTVVPEDLRSHMLPIHVIGAIVSYACLTLHIILIIHWAVRGWGGHANESDLTRSHGRALRLAIAGEAVFGIFVLGMGMIWAKMAWGRYWGWDFKETMSLITFAAYALYLYFELFIQPSSRLLRLFMAGSAYACLLVTFFLGARVSALHGYG